MVLDVMGLSWTLDSAPGLAVADPNFKKEGGNLCSNYSKISVHYLGILSKSEGIMEQEV